MMGQLVTVAASSAQAEHLFRFDDRQPAQYPQKPRTIAPRFGNSKMANQSSDTPNRTLSTSIPYTTGLGGWHDLDSLIRSVPTEKITLIVGAGIHRVPKWSCPLTSESAMRLSSWNALLDSVIPKEPSSQSPTLRWEMGILQSGVGDQASKRSKALLKTLQSNVKSAESAVLKRPDFYKLVKPILAADCVQHILSLNFDLTVEELLLSGGSRFDLVFDHIKGEKPSLKKTGNVGQLRLRRKIGERSVWHPHGDRTNTFEQCVGLRDYALSIAALESGRCAYKERERKKTLNPEEIRDWVELMMSTHLIFLGTSIDRSEWDIWFALVNRWRNGANKPQHRTFVLTTGDEHEGLPSQITRLTAPSYELGWAWLDAVMNGHCGDSLSASK